MKHIWTFIAPTLIAISSTLVAQTPPTSAPPSPPAPQDTVKTLAPTYPQFRFNGQVRERTEIDDRISNGPSPDAFHLLRTRVGATIGIGEDVRATVEIQDARTFGEKGTNLNSGAPALDLHNAFLEIGHVAGAPVTVRLGRQAVGFADERLIGKIDWLNQAPSFDGLLASVAPGSDVTVDLFGFAIARQPAGNRYVRDVFLTGAWAAWKPKDLPTVQAFYLFDTPRMDSTRQNRHTTGLYSGGSLGDFSYEVDAALQFGDRVRGVNEPVSKSISAWMTGLRAAYTFGDLANLRIGAGADLLSGNPTSDPTTYGAFNTLYATNHKYYGFMDYILNVPQATAGMGLRDFIGQVSFDIAKPLRFAADVHAMSLMDPIATSTGASVESRIGNELDLTLTYRPTPPLSVAAGFSVMDFDPNRAVLVGSASSERTTEWGYVMVTAGW